MSGRIIDAGYHLLDRQIIDFDSKLGGKVDDVELTFPQDGSAPYISDLYTGTGAYLSRIAPRLGRWLESIAKRLLQEEKPNVVWFGTVQRVQSDIEVSVSVNDLPTHRVEQWTAQNIISHIPGASSASE